MLTYVDGSLFLSPAQVLVNTVNLVGVMGKGIAKDFKAIFPEMFREYQVRCESGTLDIGKLYLYRGPNKWVLNFPTKKHWRNPSRPEYIEAGLRAFVKGFATAGINSIAFPRLGCGNGELDWEEQVRPLMEKYLSRLPISVFVHSYQSVRQQPEHLDIEATKLWLRSEPESLSFGEVWDDIKDAVRSRKELPAVGTGQLFGVKVVDLPEEGLIIGDSEGLFVPRDSLLEVWQCLRAAGFVSAASLVDGLDARAGQVMAVFAGLPYVRLTQISQCRQDRKDDYRDALLFVPRVAKTRDETGELPEAMPI